MHKLSTKLVIDKMKPLFRLSVWYIAFIGQMVCHPDIYLQIFFHILTDDVLRVQYFP